MKTQEVRKLKTLSGLGFCLCFLPESVTPPLQVPVSPPIKPGKILSPASFPREHLKAKRNGGKDKTCKRLYEHNLLYKFKQQ